MNTPFGNSITTAEHAITLMLALARQIPQADASTQAGKWEKNRFMGVEITGKTLGVIGCGNIGSIVADRAIGLKMKVIAYDPFLSPERAVDLGVEKVELDELFRRADFITLHTPLTEKTKNIIDAEALAADEEGRAHHQLRARRAGRRGGAARRARFAATSPARPSTCSSRSRRPRTRCSGIPTWSARRISAPRPPRRRRTSRCRSPSRCRTICCAARSPTPSISRRSPPRRRRGSSRSSRWPRSSARSPASSPRPASRKVQLAYEGAVAQMNTKALTSAASPACCGRCCRTSTWSPRRSSPRSAASSSRRSRARPQATTRA